MPNSSKSVNSGEVRPGSMVAATSPCRLVSCSRTSPVLEVVAARSESGPDTLRVIDPRVVSSMVQRGSSESSP
jgi:hypothetical protein